VFGFGIGVMVDGNGYYVMFYAYGFDGWCGLLGLGCL